MSALNAAAESEREILKHVKTRKADRHEDNGESEDDMRRMMRTVEVWQRS